MKFTASVLNGKGFAHTAGKDVIIPALCAFKPVGSPDPLLIQGKFIACVIFPVDFLTEINTVNIVYQDINGAAVRYDMMGIKQEIRPFIGDIDLGAEQHILRIKVEGVNQFSSGGR